jgi:hypothetical protein
MLEVRDQDKNDIAQRIVESLVREMRSADVSQSERVKTAETDVKSAIDGLERRSRTDEDARSVVKLLAAGDIPEQKTSLDKTSRRGGAKELQWPKMPLGLLLSCEVAIRGGQQPCMLRRRK